MNRLKHVLLTRMTPGGLVYMSLLWKRNRTKNLQIIISFRLYILLYICIHKEIVIKITPIWKTTYNFNAGPCILPEALQAGNRRLKISAGQVRPLLRYHTVPKNGEAVMNECRVLRKELLNIPDNYDDIFSWEAEPACSFAWFPWTLEKKFRLPGNGCQQKGH